MSLVVAWSFCSHLRPLGALSEWLGGLGRKLLASPVSYRVFSTCGCAALNGCCWLFLGAVWFGMTLGSLRVFLDSP